MYVSIDAAARVRLDDASNFTEFYVQAHGAGLETVHDALAQADAGYVRDEHAWIHRSFLEENLAQTQAGWQPAVDRMLAYARSKGWVTTQGRESVRAHIEGLLSR